MLVYSNIFKNLQSVQKSGPAKLTESAHHGRISIRKLTSLDYSLGPLVFILEESS